MKPIFIVFVFVLLLLDFTKFSESKGQYVEPLSMGMKMSVPYDLANIFKHPIAGTISVLLAVSLAVILFFGVITAPFGYFFGIPSRKYVMGGPPSSGRSARSMNDFEYLNSSDIFEQYENSCEFPTFTESLFYLMPEKDLEDENCKLLIACYAHSTVNNLPDWALRLYAVFSRNLGPVSSSYKSAILLGINTRNECRNIYSCQDSEFSLLVKTFLNFLPASFKNENFRKRKGAMYL